MKDSIFRVREAVSAILNLVACGGSHEIERNKELDGFDPEVETSEDGTMLLTFPGRGTGRRFRVTVERID